MKVLLLSYGFDGTDVGEALVAFQWAKALAERAEVTVLGLERPGRPPLTPQLPGLEVVTWPEPAFLQRAERFNAMLKPAYPLLWWRVRRWIRRQLAAGRSFDIAHQIMPQAARYPCPFHGLGIPYVIGPLGGALPTPPGFASEVGTARWYTRLRALDQWRFRHDPWLRRSYAGAELVMGVAPYMAQSLASIPLKRFEPVLELGVDELPPERPPRTGPGLKLLHVGRGVRTKGLRDVVRAMAQITDLDDVTLTSAGRGEEIALAEAEAQRLGVADRVNFLGQVPRARVEELYAEADIFTFPSFREPAGGVLYEAMRAGLPVITVDYGGPAFIVDNSCGIRLPVTTPEALARDVGGAIRTLHDDPERRLAMGRASRARVVAQGHWPNKIARLMGQYETILGGDPAAG